MTRRPFRAPHYTVSNAGLFEMVGSARDHDYRSLVCEDRLASRTQAERHVLRHFFEEAQVQHIMAATRSNGQEDETQDEKPPKGRRRSQGPRRRSRRKGKRA